MPPTRIIIIGAGERGATYAQCLRQQKRPVTVVAVADPRDQQRNKLADDWRVPAENRFTDWKLAAERRRFADAAIIALPDRLHADPAVAFSRLGYHILLEKPMAPTEKECRRIVQAARAGKILAVCHVMRYTDYTQKIKEIVDSGRIGEVVSIHHLEPVGFWHQAHSYVRGNWRREKESSPMLLAKSCHDLDWIRYIMGEPCQAVSSFGGLRHFTRKLAPKGSAARCVDCGVEPTCPYSASRLYLGRLRQGKMGWPVSVVANPPTAAGVWNALRHGPYGRCVYRCDNDAVDHQVVNMLFAGGKTASFTMTAFTSHRGRETYIFGTKGELYGDGAQIEHYDFLTDETAVIDTTVPGAPQVGTHGGGDYRLIENFVAAVAENNPRRILTGAKESLETHLMVFAAEEARKKGRVVRIKGKG